MRRKEVRIGEIEAGVIDEDQPIADVPYRIVETWEPVEPTEEWSDWVQVHEETDEDPTYIAEYDYQRASLFHVPMKALHPHRKRSVTFERKLVRRWVSKKKGPLMQVVDTERRVERW